MNPTRAACFSGHVAILTLTLLIASWRPAAFAETGARHYTLATATTGGTFYPVGVALATLTKVKLEPKYNIALSAVSSAGSAENIQMLQDHRAQFAILQSLYGAWAWDGAGELKEMGPQRNLRAISMLWRNAEHFIIRTDYTSTGHMADLAAIKDHWFSLGKRGSGTEGSGSYILEQLGFNAQNDFQITSIDYGSNTTALRNGAIDGMNIPGGPPVAAVSQAFAAYGKDLTILTFTDRQLQRVNSIYPLWSRYVIPPGTYPGQTEAIHTIAQPNLLVVQNEVEDEVVYQIVKAIYQNLDFLRIIHPATNTLSLDEAISGMPIPLHPGAARFYRERGIEIPDKLISR